MDSLGTSAGCKQELRPPPCPACGVIGWWNGWVFVAQMVVGEDGEVERVLDMPRHRARCKEPECPYGSWTIYELGGYPHRAFTLAVAAAAVAELTIEAGATLTSVARHWDCDRRTVARWNTWIAGIAAPAALAKLCSHLDPDGLPAPEPEGLATPGSSCSCWKAWRGCSGSTGCPWKPVPVWGRSCATSSNGSGRCPG